MKVKVSPMETKEESFSDNSEDDQSQLDPNEDENKNGNGKFVSKNLQNFTKLRADLKEKVTKGILEQILPDIGQYDVDGVVERPPQKDGLVRRWLKIVGCISLNIHESILSGSSDFLLKAIKHVNREHPELVNEYNEEGRTPLSVAVKVKREDMVSMLLDFHALPDICDKNTGRSPLLQSVHQQTLSITRYLLRCQASVDLCDFHCVTPLMTACANSDVSHCKLILDKRPNIDAQDENGWSALHYAAFGNAFGCINLLLEEGADRNLKDANKRKPIHIARHKNNGESIAALEDLQSRIAFATGEIE